MSKTTLEGTLQWAVVKPAILLELLASSLSLISSGKELACLAHVLRAADTWMDVELDRLDGGFLHYFPGVAPKVLWVRRALPCRTFSCAWRTLKWAKAKVMRSAE